MITEGEARAKVQGYLGTDDFELQEFVEGWRVLRQIPRDIIGSGTFAVERSSGALLHFPSSIPPNRVSEEFNEVRADGHPVS